MGCAASRESSGPNSDHRRKHHPSSSYYDWDKKGGYIPYRHKGERRPRWHQEDKEAYAQQVRDEAERERNREALKYYNVHVKRGNLRRPHDDDERRKEAARAKREMIKVYASPDLKSRWSD
ncbi:hypothetical protein HO133_005940 [Letharia lupina]|uniref:Uncharacterized protein n=1 Tax=Letharia lupina TaxID=560253 RepID=A0A8H6C8H0_9LECA|nr:uncharacterized protein HO133_005940 [Letharia lupina]KAF6218589.1 hypothetical protein HO133_005940 [Letharia lupina]